MRTRSPPMNHETRVLVFACIGAPALVRKISEAEAPVLSGAWCGTAEAVPLTKLRGDGSVAGGGDGVGVFGEDAAGEAWGWGFEVLQAGGDLGVGGVEGQVGCGGV